MAGVQLVVTAHQHRFRYDAPAAGRPWAQLVGGGCSIMKRATRGKDGGAKAVYSPNFPTVIEGRAKDGKLSVTVHNIASGEVAGVYTFS